MKKMPVFCSGRFEMGRDTKDWKQKVDVREYLINNPDARLGNLQKREPCFSGVNSFLEGGIGIE